MAKETNVITREEIARVRELDFATLFGENVNNLITMLGVTRRIPVTAGSVLKKLSVKGTLESGEVAEGDIIPLSKYETEWTAVGEMELLKWRKATTGEAILKGGFDQAVNETDNKLLLDIQKSIRTKLIASLDDDDATAVSGTELQAVLAKAWGQLQVLFEDDSIQAVYFINPLDIADYLSTANITVQTAFGFSYVENFLGLGNVIMSGKIPQGKIYATASENIIAYYINANESNGLGDAFDFTTDPETGFVGLHEDSNYTRLQSETVAISGVVFFPEMPSGIVKGTIGSGTGA